MKVGIVCGYGNIVDDNLTDYLDFVISHIKEEKIDQLILSGGCSFTKSPISEAQLMKQLITNKISDIDLFLEEKSLTTLHNLLYSKEFLDNLENNQIQAIYIYCDQVRYFKINCLAKIIFRDYPIKVIKSQRKENILIYSAQIPSLFIQCLGAIFPNIEKKILINKKKWIQKYR
ncbi:ElyC/SanA/YdcF family protein [Planktothrix sp. FACHB-1365]|uniref:ElyC/SanA/YdcF family protein n=1 Tax=Planktothrix sp. FACHB-1365 TaxID=2692855 RepID=UPI001685EB4F|nr:ElyC/SanA/YdcF family protein [Planktothrix sp. FACHB-1365]MBD2482704.1 YdcF family protein [Planktothrix sp. FACHB-1365]